MKKITSVAFIMLAALSLEAQSPASNRTTQQEREAAFKNASLDVPYCDRSEAQKLDVFLPVNGEGPFPVIIYVHGGGWNSQDKSRTKHFLYSPLQNGYATVTINYRLSGEAIFPAQVHDLKAAIRWVKANAAEYGFDAGRIILWGDSAGGHLVALAGTSGGAAELEDMSMGNDGYDSRVNAVIDYFGVTNFYKMDEYKVKEGGESSLDSSTGSMAQLMGAPISQIPDKVRMADPTTFISKDTPPFMLVHGDADPSVPYHLSVDFAADLEKVVGKQNVELIILPGAKHGGREFTSPELMERIYNFLDSHLEK